MDKTTIVRDFAMWLTTQPQALTVGASIPVYDMLAAVDAYLELPQNADEGIAAANDAALGNALTGLLGIAIRADSKGEEPKVKEVAEPMLVIVGNLLGNLGRIADSLEGLHNMELGKGVASKSLTEAEWETIEALRNGSAIVQPATRRHM